jgi:hypothetical protein
MTFTDHLQHGPAPWQPGKLSHTLTKLKIGHLIDADRGPFTFDIVERDRKVVYECDPATPGNGCNGKIQTHQVVKIEL